MKTLLRSTLCTIALLAAFSVSARADSYNFTYTFGDGRVWSGSFDGTAAGNLVTGISNVSLFDNGVSVGTPIYAGNYTFSMGYQLGGSVFSFDGLQNNFALFNGDYFGGSGFTAYLINSPDLSNYIYYTDSGAFGLDTPIASSRWSLTSAQVPEGGVTVALLGSGLLGLATLRRKFSRG